MLLNVKNHVTDVKKTQLKARKLGFFPVRCYGIICDFRLMQRKNISEAPSSYKDVTSTYEEHVPFALPSFAVCCVFMGLS